MKNRVQNLLYGRKTLYLVLAIVMISVFTLSIAYAAMSSVLEIHGNSEVVASTTKFKTTIKNITHRWSTITIKLT